MEHAVSGEEAPAFVVRPAREEDFAAVEALTVRVYIGEGYSLPAIEPWLRDVATRAAATELLVAVDSITDQVVGSVSLMTQSGSYVQITQAGEAEFRLLAVDDAARRRGSGEALVQACIERARAFGCSRLVLSTQPSMVSAQRLYERLGFRRAPERDWQTSSGGSRLVYSLAL